MKKNNPFREHLGCSLKKILLTMRFAIFLLFFGILEANATEIYSQQTKISLDFKNTELMNVLDKIESESEFFFLYNEKLIDTDRKISISAKDQLIGTVLDELFKGTNVNYTIVDRKIILAPDYISQTPKQQDQQQKLISGVVSDNNGNPLTGVNVTVSGTTIGTMTDIEGKYHISAPSGAKALSFSFIGMQPQEIALGNQSVINVTLSESTVGLKEVVVTALGIKHDEKSLGYAVQKVDSKTLTTVKGENIATSLTGKVAGLMVKNTTEFFRSSSIKLRGSNALLVVNGVPATDLTLDDIAPDDIADISILKGATASALYGNRGSNGAIMITTKSKENESTFSVEINSNTLLRAGYLKIPKTQKNYGTGVGNLPIYDGEFVWGPRLNMGTTAMQVDPVTGTMVDRPLRSIGTNNLKNFLEESIVTNNNISVAQTTKNGAIRGSFSHVFNKGEAPNTTSNKYIFNLSGTMNVSDKFTLDASWNFARRETPNQPNYGYGRNGSYIYLLTVWNGPDFDIRQWKDYWLMKDKKQKYYQTGWYDNPYFLAYEVLNPHSIDVNTGQMTATYTVLPGMKVLLRNGINTYGDRYTQQQAISYNRSGKGYFLTGQDYSMDLNNDLLVTYTKEFGKFGFDALGGGAVNYYEYRETEAHTNNGLSIPGFYSLNASIDPVSASSLYQKKQVNSLYGKISLSLNKAFYLDLTGRNDWSSTLPSTTRSYFYPSASFSTIMSELINLPEAISFWKLRASWTVSKQDLSIFDLNQAYNVRTNAWNGYNSQSYPSTIRGEEVNPQTSRVYELGTNIRFFENRLNIDYSYFNRLQYNLLVNTPISSTTGYDYKQTNTDEQWLQKGMEVTIIGIPVTHKSFEWNVMLNWSYNHWYYDKLDPIYSDKKTYIGVGKRMDVVRTRDWERDPSGNLVVGSDGYPKKSYFFSDKIGFSDPDWIWGLTNTLKFKSWSFYVTFDGRIGGRAYSDTEYGLWAAGSHPDSDNDYRYQEVVNGKVEYVGDGVKIASGELVRDGTGKVISDNRVFARNDIKVPYTAYMEAWSGYGSDDGGNPRVAPRELYFSETFVKLRELAINYTLPSELCKKIGFKSSSVGIVGQNLLILAKGFRFDDPDAGTGNLPSPSQRYVGLNLKFGL